MTLGDPESGPITTPEWVNGEPTRPVVYARNLLSNSITIKAAFSGGRPGEAVAIRAIAERPGVNRTVGTVLDVLFGSASVLGPVKPREVRFGDDGESGLVSFEIKSHATPPAVGVYHVRWTWQMRVSARWVDFATLEVPVYILAAVPSPPWSRSLKAKAWQIPWASAIALSSQWASGATLGRRSSRQDRDGHQRTPKTSLQLRG